MSDLFLKAINLKELIEHYGLPLKVCSPYFTANRLYFEARYIHENMVYGHFDSGVAETFRLDSVDWSIYKEPKKKTKLYKYAYYGPKVRRWINTIEYYKDDKDFLSEFDGTPIFKFVRLDYTMIEVEE